MAASLSVLAEQLCLHVKEIREEAISKNVDCQHFAEAAAIVSKLYCIMMACLRQKMYREHWNQACRSSGCDLETRPTVRDLDAVRKALLRCLNEHARVLLVEYKPLPGQLDCLFDRMAQLFFTIDLVQFQDLPTQTAKALSEFAATRDEWLCEQNIAVVDLLDGDDGPGIPVLQYRVSQLNSALFQLASVWLGLAFDDRLVRYLELLRIRFGQLLNFTFDGSVHDVEELRQATNPGAPPGQRVFQLNSRALRTLGPVMADMLKRVVLYSSFTPADSMSMAQLRAAVEPWVGRLGQWLRAKSQEMLPDGASELLQKHLVDMSLRPGERVVYAREFNAKTHMSDAQYILGQ
jgi:hypothetical protein